MAKKGKCKTCRWYRPVVIDKKGTTLNHGTCPEAKTRDNRVGFVHESDTCKQWKTRKGSRKHAA